MESKKYIIGFFGLTILFLLAYYIPYLYFSGPYIEDEIKYEEDSYIENPVLWESSDTQYAAVRNDDIIADNSETEQIEYEYFLLLENNHINVYKSDKETLYFRTSIRTDVLSNEEIVELTQGKYILNVEELYGFLESHTS